MSLKEAGLETLQTTGGRSWLHVRMPHSYIRGDELVTEAWEPLDVYRSMKEGQTHICLKLLTELLAKNPEAVRLHPNCFRQADESVRRIREVAEALNMAVDFQGLPASAGRQSLTAPSDSPQGSQPGLPVSSGRQSLTAHCGASAAPRPQTAREALCMDVLLRHLAPGRQHWPQCLPRVVWKLLKDNLEQGALKGFMLQRPEFFTVQEEGRYWSFTVRSIQSPGSASDSENVVAPSTAASSLAVAVSPPAASLPATLISLSQGGEASPPPQNTPIDWEAVLGDDRRLRAGQGTVRKETESAKASAPSRSQGGSCMSPGSASGDVGQGPPGSASGRWRVPEENLPHASTRTPALANQPGSRSRRMRGISIAPNGEEAVARPPYRDEPASRIYVADNPLRGLVPSSPGDLPRLT